jgi:hypothetical protein
MFKSNTPPRSITHSYIAPLVRIFVLAAFLVTATQTSAEATWQFDFINHSGKTVDMFFAAENNAKSWGNNIFDTTPVYHNGAVGIRLGSNARYWKFKVIFQDGSSKYWKGVDMRASWTRMILKRDRVVYN